MKKRCSIIIALLLLTFSYSIMTSAQHSKLINFKLNDQFDRVYSDEDYSGELFIMIGGDRKGSRFSPEWGEAIRAELQKNEELRDIKILRVADVRGVPFFLKGVVKKKFPKEREKWVVIDWEGRFATHYEFKDEFCNIVVFDEKGQVIHQTAGQEPEEKEILKIMEIIESASASDREKAE